jgi:hypothetical protein
MAIVNQIKAKPGPIDQGGIRVKAEKFPNMKAEALTDGRTRTAWF